ncbi:hypothetical protein RB653_002236 [Dictyostelium firmibasis]|uniref:Pesticidal crystal protein N-terminal domain-containing protein n=1 Tax=Dictyostelium firmibasis TaxID=79012 RepID=A0AAN7YYK5_9MYCE
MDTSNNILKLNIKNGFGKNSSIFDMLASTPNNIFDPYDICYGEKRSNQDINESLVSILNNISNLYPLIIGFFTVFFEKPINSTIDKDNLKVIVEKMLKSDTSTQEKSLKTSNEWIKSCVDLMMNIYENNNDLKKLLFEKKDKLLNSNYKKHEYGETRHILETNIEKLEKSIQELLILLSNSLENIHENINIYYESIFVYIAFIHNVDLLWEVYDIDPILITGAKKSDRLSDNNVSSFRERLHVFISSFLKDVGGTSEKTMLNPCWNDMYKVLGGDLILYPQKLIIFNELITNTDRVSGLKQFNLPEINNQNYIFRFDAKYIGSDNDNNKLKDYITGCYGMSFYSQSEQQNGFTNSKLSFILESKTMKFISIRLYGMKNEHIENININVFNCDDDKPQQLVDQDTIKPLTLQLSNYLPSMNNLDSNFVGFTNTKKIKLNNVKNLIEINFNGNDQKKYFLYFIEILVSYQKQ